MERRARLFARLQRITNQNEERAQELPAHPAERAASLGPRGEGNLSDPLQRHWHDAEIRGAEHGEDDVRRGDGAGAGRPDEDEVAGSDDGDAGLDEEEVAL